MASRAPKMNPAESSLKMAKTDNSDKFGLLWCVQRPVSSWRLIRKYPVLYICSKTTPTHRNHPSIFFEISLHADPRSRDLFHRATYLEFGFIILFFIKRLNHFGILQGWLCVVLVVIE